jgi:hypothetical protein
MKAEKRKKGRTKESILQPLETREDLAVSSTPDAKFRIMLLVVGLPEFDQFLDRGVALLIHGVLHRAELLHLGVVVVPNIVVPM